MAPSTLLSILLGSAYGSLFHIWQGEKPKDLLFYLIIGAVGFSLGQILAPYLGFQLYAIGTLHIIEASIICWITLFLAHWLKIKPKKSSQK